jgi:transcriptional regulator with XRE-family HTH domain
MQTMMSPERMAEQRRQFGQNMRAARRRTGLAQNKLGLDKSMISRLELGVRSPRLQTLLRVAKVLEVMPQALLEGIGENGAELEPPPPGDGALTPRARFGANLRWARLREPVSQMDLAHEAGIDRAGVSGLERGLQDPELDTILKLAWTLELPPALLLHGVSYAHRPGSDAGSS